MANVPIVNGAQNSLQPTPTRLAVNPVVSAVPAQSTKQPQNIASVQNAVSPVVNSVPAKPMSNSPWDDDVESSEISPDDVLPVIGSLDPKNIPPEANSVPLKVPENVEEKVGQKLPATGFMSSNNNQSSSIQNPKPGFLGGLFSKKKTSVPAAILPKVISPPTPTAASSVVPPKTEAKKSNPVLKKVLILVPGLIVVFALASFLTEIGLLSIGIENVYGAVGIEKLWGGLSQKTETALGQSALTMQSHPDFKAEGKISITVDRAIKSDIVTPLLSLNAGQSLARDESINIAQKATQTAVDDYYFTSNSNSNSSINSNSNLSSNANSNSNSITSPPTNANSNGNLEGNTNINSTSGIATEEETTSGTKVVEGTFGLKTSSTSNEISIKLNDLDSSSITLVNDSGKLFVKASGSVNYGSTDKTKWVTYGLDQIKDESIVSNIFNLKVDSGFSVKGARVGNEKVGDTRCYKYRIDSLEIGDSLENIGITSDMVPTLSGDVWIGIKDKLIQKMNLKITTPVSSAVRMVNLEMIFSDFDVKNSITKIASSDQVIPQNLTGDAKRKADVVALVAALKKYKDDNKSYPVSVDLLKLNTTDNSVAKALVPRYLTSLPEDPKTTEGWYYAYKSADGTKCSISSRLENATDPEGSLINGVLLYLKYSSD